MNIENQKKRHRLSHAQKKVIDAMATGVTLWEGNLSQKVHLSRSTQRVDLVKVSRLTFDALLRNGYIKMGSRGTAAADFVLTDLGKSCAKGAKS